jgi:xylan 1,4-beta-xylosidase
MITLTCDLGRPTVPFPHYWEQCVGSGHAALGLRQDWREQLERCHDELGFQYVRFHGLLNDDISVYAASFLTDTQYSFFNVDSIFDFLLEIGMKPFVELSFMPSALASGPQTVFHYRGNITPPRDYAAWAELIHTLTAHLVARYGVAEVRSWFLEVWNEPNLPFFWSGTQDEYFELYRHAAQAVKSVDPDIPVGGPSTACNEWIPELRAYCEQNDVPLDFCSTHHYPTDAALGHGMDMESQMSQVERGILRGMTARAREQAGDLPLYYTEWNNSPSCRDPYHDDPYAAAFCIKTIVDNAGLADAYSYWTFSDIFEEAPFPSAPFHGGFGLLSLHGIPKPTFHAFQLLHSLGTERLPMDADVNATVEAVATVDDQRVLILLYNHNVPLAPIEEETVEIVLKGWQGDASAWIERVDSEHANPKRRWLELGSPQYPNTQALDDIAKASQRPREPISYHKHDDKISLCVTVPAHGIVAVGIEKGEK